MVLSARMTFVTLFCAALAACGPTAEVNTVPQAASTDTVSQTDTSSTTVSTPTTGTTTTGSTTTTDTTTTGSTTTGSTTTTDSTTTTGTTATSTTTTTAGTTTTIGTVLTNAIQNASAIIVAAFSTDSFTTLRVKATTDSVAASDVGAFRNTCGYSHMAFDDPIVFPGQAGASHLHVFFGNTSTNAATTTASLFAAKRSTCVGGIANSSAYWVPALIDTTTNRALVPIENVFYYKGGYSNIARKDIQPLPEGLRMIAGNKATENKDLGPYGGAHHDFRCFADSLPNGWSGGGQAVVKCPTGSKFAILLDFPNCWDGVNLDSPDHRSHMAYTSDKCPTSHPVPVPQVSFIINYEVPAGTDTTTWRLASDNYDGPGGYSMHGDVWAAWDKDILAAWQKNCINASQDCHGYLLGDGRTLY